MSEKFQNKYRIASIRLQNWDYRWNASYFVTICTHQRQHFFGKVINGKMHLSQIGLIADILWYEIKNRSKNVILDEFVVMPNHIHGIITICDYDENDTNGTNGTNVETRRALSLHASPTFSSSPDSQTIGQKRFQNQGKNSLSSIVGSYKSSVTKHAHRLGFEFAWQSRFYENIVRDEKAFEYIAAYINNNPAKWSEDRFFK